MKLNLGSGLDYREGYCNIDFNREIKADKYIDLNKIPYPFGDNSVEHIICNQMLEHLHISIYEFLKECNRIMKPGTVLQMNFPNTFFWRNRISFLFGDLRGTYFAPYHTKLIHPKDFKFPAMKAGFSIKIHKTGLPFLPLSLSEYNLCYTLRKESGKQ